MKLVLKEKVFTLKERFNVTDEQEQPLYSVEGKFFSWGHQFDVEDASGAHVAHIQQKVLALLPRYFITCDGMEEMELKGHINIIHPHYTLETPDGDWEVRGTADLSEVQQELDVELPTEDCDTFGGLVFAELGTIPEDGTTCDITIGRLEIHVQSVADHQMEVALVHVLPKENTGDDDDDEDEDDAAQMVLRLGFPVVILVGATMLGQGEIDFLTYLIFLLTASRIYDPLSTVMMQLAEIFNAQIQIGRMKAMENQPVQEGSNWYNPQGYDIVFDRVGFSYNKNESVLREVSFTAKQGEVTALIGPSGGGKTTAAKLAARFWDAVSGKTTVGGVDVTTVDPETLLQSFAIVFQDVVLFNDTIFNNIRMGRKNASDAEVLAAAKAACCDEFVRRFPQGYDTIIGENGATLSGGERQRISIARALLKDAPIILLDEATASLDVENETLIQKALSRLLRNKTVLVIAHRMRTVAGADHIVALDGGKVVEQGRPEQLMQTGRLYPRMVQLQQQSAGWTLN